MFYNKNMLNQLVIENVALIDKLKIDFGFNFNVLSGETGAGKSIIIDSLSFVLGGKFDKNLIRSGEKTACVSAFFSDIKSETKQTLENLGIQEDDSLVLFRSAGEKNICKINGENVTLSMLLSVASTLVDIHGQNENQRILNCKNQLEIIDGFCGDEAKKLKQQLEKTYTRISEIEQSLQNLGGNKLEQERKLDFLKFEVKEIEDAKIKENEDEALSEQKAKMLASEKISSNIAQAFENLNGQFNLSGAISEAISHLFAVSSFDSKLDELASRLKSCKIELNDILDELDKVRESLDFSQFEFDKIDARLDKIKSLKKKYGPNLEDVFAFLEKAKQEINEIENSEEITRKLENEKQAQIEKFNQLAENLSQIRKKAALSFESKVCCELNDLAMKNAKFQVSFEKVSMQKNGTDKVTFLFSANSGQELKPLGKIISGGEMSRFCLAIKNITFASDNIETMVFDEVDTGISGKVAEVVAEKMVKISRSKQVLAITHLPQIVAMADSNFFIEKQLVDGKTKTFVKLLDEQGQIGEVARLIGSNMASEHAALHATDLVKFGQNFKNNLKQE